MLWQPIGQQPLANIIDKLSDELKNPLIRATGPDRVTKATACMDTDELAYILRSLRVLKDDLILTSLSASAIQINITIWKVDHSN